MNRTVHTRFASFAQAHSLRMLVLLATLLVSSIAAMAQTTSFTYQGRLTDAGNPANGSYDLQVKLFDALTGGTQIGATNSLNGVAVSGGVFTVTLDFGAAAFPGANRWAEISAKAAGSANFTTLTPRQPVTSTPYAIKSLSAAAADGLSASCAGCVTGAQIGSLPATSGNYIQNTTTQQANSNFFISQVGTAGQDLNAGREITVDFGGTFNGNFTSFGGLRFGNTGFQTGEGIASKRTAGGNQFGLDFYTNYVSRLSIVNNGNVGIGTSTPGDRLEIGTFSDPADNYLTIKTAGGNQRRGGIKFRVFDGNLGFTIENDERQASNGLNILRHTANAQLQPVTFSALFIDKQNGNIGVGTTSPGSLLTLKSGSATAPALEVNQGAIKVAGATIRTDKNGTSSAVFVHKTTAANILDGFTTFIENHPLASGDANAILLVTVNRNPGLGPSVDNPNPIGVVFDGANWRIYNANGAAMPVGVSFNVMVIKP
ncbi:MAG: hypothetical protein KA368_10020 [Acidobacteria bacterium]|nr:hypothetical protein [Acidobacteriota bacterium]